MLGADIGIAIVGVVFLVVVARADGEAESLQYNAVGVVIATITAKTTRTITTITVVIIVGAPDPRGHDQRHGGR